MTMKGGVRTLTKNVYRIWLGGLLTSLLLTCVLLYCWRKTSLPRLYRWSSQQQTATLSQSTSPPEHQAQGRNRNSVFSRKVEQVMESENDVQQAFVKDQPQLSHVSSVDNRDFIRAVQDAAGGDTRRTSRTRRTGREGGRTESAFILVRKGFSKIHQKALRERPPRAGSFQDVSDIDVRLLLPRRSVSGVGEETCSPHHHLVLVKVHKAASSTVANIIQRYGLSRNLNFVLPNKATKRAAYNYISKPGENFTKDFILPHPPGGHYDLLWNHAVYNRTAFDAFMPHDTVYISILREPFQQFVSAYAFYNLPYINKFVSLRVNPFSHYLHFMPHPQLLDYFRNKQSEDLGMTAEHVQNSTLRHQYLQKLNRELQLVLITEFFDESLVLLRRLMCWSVKDILYITKNKNTYKPSFVFSSQDYDRHQELAPADYELYQFFKHKLLRTIAAQGVDFEHEVTHFREVLSGVEKFCEQAQVQGPRQFFVPKSPWSLEFNVSIQDCQLLVMPELKFLDKLLDVTHARLKQPSSSADHGSSIPPAF